MDLDSYDEKEENPHGLSRIPSQEFLNVAVMDDTPKQTSSTFLGNWQNEAPKRLCLLDVFFARICNCFDHFFFNFSDRQIQYYNAGSEFRYVC